MTEREMVRALARELREHLLNEDTYTRCIANDLLEDPLVVEILREGK